jgi:hypothetical protein
MIDNSLADPLARAGTAGDRLFQLLIAPADIPRGAAVVIVADGALHGVNFETLPVDSTVGRLIVCGSDQAAIANHVFRKCPNLSSAVRALVVQGFTTAEEALELLRPQRQ